MRKLTIIISLLAAVSLSSCIKSEPIEYEIVADNQTDSYSAEIVTVDKYPTMTFSPNEEYESFTLKGSRTGILRKLLFFNGGSIRRNVMYRFNMVDEKCLFTVKFNEKKTPDYLLLANDFIKNAGIKTDTTFKPSYLLTVLDLEKYKEATNLDQRLVEGVSMTAVFDNGNTYTYFKRPDTIKGCIMDMFFLTNNLRSYHNIPAILDTGNIVGRTPIIMNYDFFKHMPIEQIQETLGNYGIGLVPTGEDMMVLNFSADKAMLGPMFFQSREFTWKFIIITILGLIFILHFYSQRMHPLLPKYKNWGKVALALFFWCIALFFIIMIVFINNNYNYNMIIEGMADKNVNVWFINGLVVLLWGIVYINIAIGIYALRYRKSMYDREGRIIRIVLMIYEVIMAMFILFVITYGKIRFEYNVISVMLPWLFMYAKLYKKGRILKIKKL